MWWDFYICSSLTLDSTFLAEVLPAQEWKPPLPAYDFLSMMDAAASEHLTRKDPECIKETDVQESDKEQPDDKSAITEESTGTLKMKHSSRSSWFEEAKKLLRHDNKELWYSKVS